MTEKWFRLDEDQKKSVIGLLIWAAEEGSYIHNEELRKSCRIAAEHLKETSEGDVLVVREHEAVIHFKEPGPELWSSEMELGYIPTTSLSTPVKKAFDFFGLARDPDVLKQMDAHLRFARLANEIERARKKFPGTGHLFTALVEEVGELAKALLEEGNSAQSIEEAIQVACVAWRIVEEDDADFPVTHVFKVDADETDPVDVHGPTLYVLPETSDPAAPYFYREGSGTWHATWGYVDVDTKVAPPEMEIDVSEGIAHFCIDGELVTTITESDATKREEEDD